MKGDLRFPLQHLSCQCLLILCYLQHLLDLSSIQLTLYRLDISVGLLDNGGSLLEDGFSCLSVNRFGREL